MERAELIEDLKALERSILKENASPEDKVLIVRIVGQVILDINQIANR
jgi:hypothetical protein